MSSSSEGPEGEAMMSLNESQSVPNQRRPLQRLSSVWSDLQFIRKTKHKRVKMLIAGVIVCIAIVVGIVIAVTRRKQDDGASIEDDDAPIKDGYFDSIHQDETNCSTWIYENRTKELLYGYIAVYTESNSSMDCNETISNYQYNCSKILNMTKTTSKNGSQSKIQCCTKARICNDEDYCNGGKAVCIEHPKRKRHQMLTCICPKGYMGSRCQDEVPHVTIMCTCYKIVFNPNNSFPNCKDVLFPRTGKCLLERRNSTKGKCLCNTEKKADNIKLPSCVPDI